MADVTKTVTCPFCQMSLLVHRVEYRGPNLPMLTPGASMQARYGYDLDPAYADTHDIATSTVYGAEDPAVMVIRCDNRG